MTDVMDTFECIRSRRSVRHFSDEAISDDDLRTLMDVCRHAPSAHNTQAWKVIVIKDRDKLEKLAAVKRTAAPIGRAPMALAVITDRNGTVLPEQDGTILADHITLAARAMGIGTCWIGRMDREEVHEILRIPNDWHIVTVMPIGYPAEDWPAPKPRKDVEEIVFREDMETPYFD